jgi:hypothetical protein
MMLDPLAIHRCQSLLCELIDAITSIYANHHWLIVFERRMISLSSSCEKDV